MTRNGRPLILLALAALLPLVALALGISVIALRQQQHSIEQGARERTERIAALVERELDAQLDLLRTLAQSPVLDGTPDPRLVADLLTRARRGRPLWLAASLSDREGVRLVDVPEPINGAAGGRVVDPGSHAKVVETQTPALGPVRRGGRDRPAFAARVPVLRGEPTEARMVLSAVIDPTQLRDVLFTAGLPEGWIGAVIDGEGNLAARSVGPSTLIGQPASESARAARARAGAGIYEGASLEGIPTFTAYRVLPSSNWSVHVAVPLAVHQAPVTRSLWLIGVGSVLASALVGLFSWLLWREWTVRQAGERVADETRRLEALGRMTGGVAHDFNNLLMIVQGSAEALKRRGSDPARVATFADAILAASQRGQAITRQLLAFARKSPYEPTSFSLAQRADELLALLRRSARGDIRTSLSLAPDLWPIHADPNALEVALINLAVNARDAMPNGGRLTVEAGNVLLTRQQDEGTGLLGGFVRITVRDTGTGIPAESLGRIFEPFFTTKGPSQGTGLGLSQVHGFARQSGGTVRVESVGGQGAVFHLYLPRALSGPAIQQPPVDRVGRSGSGHVLLVEDNPEVAEVTTGMLTGLGYQVTSVPDARSALAKLSESALKVDAVLSDVMLGEGASGLDLAEQLLVDRPGLPVVLMTGYSEALAKGRRLGLVVLGKPFGEAQLSAALAEVLGEDAPASNVVSLAR